MDIQLFPITADQETSHAPDLPGSKSLTNRALCLAFSKKGEVDIVGGLHAEDTEQFAKCIDQFGGIEATKTSNGYRTKRCSNESLTNADGDLFINAAGTPARFLLTMIADSIGKGTLKGNTRLNERPMGAGIESIRNTGRTVSESDAENCLPVEIIGGPLASTQWRVASNVSSQFVSSALLSAARQSKNIGTIEIEAVGKVVSRPYIDMTVKFMRSAGIEVNETGTQSWSVRPGNINTSNLVVEPDASAMSYFLGAAAILGTTVKIDGLGRESCQGDVGFVNVLEQMGCAVVMNNDFITLTGPADGLSGVDVDMDDMPDTVLTLAVVAAFAETPTKIRNVANLRVKECDRLAAAESELKKLGVKVSSGPDWIKVYPCKKLRAASIETYDDHRVAMAFSLVGLIVPGIVIEDISCVSKSFPEYWSQYQLMRESYDTNSFPIKEVNRNIVETA